MKRRGRRLGQRTRGRKASQSRARRRCLRRYGRTPGRVIALRARALSAHKIILAFNAPGSDGLKPPAARSYLIKQSPQPIHGVRQFADAPTLCHGRCRFSVIAVGAKIMLAVTGLRPHTTYYYAIAARDNVSGRPGGPSTTVQARTR